MSTYDELLEKKIRTDKELCLQKIEDALEALRKEHEKEKEYASTKRVKYFPSIDSVMNVIKNYYPNDVILDTFDPDELFFSLKERNSWELDSYVQDELDKQEKSLREDFDEELDAIDTDVCHQLEDMTPDEWWDTVAKVFGICSPMDTERMKHGIAKMMEKLNRSNYQTGWRRIAAAFFRKCKDYGEEKEEVC